MRPISGGDKRIETTSSSTRVATSSAHAAKTRSGKEGCPPSMMASRVTASAVARLPPAARVAAPLRCGWVGKVELRATGDPARLPRIRHASVRPRSPPRRDPAAFPPRVGLLAIAARVPRRVAFSIRSSQTPSAPSCTDERYRFSTYQSNRPSPARLLSQLRAEQSSGKQVGSEDAVQEAASPKGEGEVLDLPSESAGETSAEPSLGDQIRELG